MRTLRGFLLGLVAALVVVAAAKGAPPVLHYVTASAQGSALSGDEPSSTVHPGVSSGPEETDSPDPQESESPEPADSGTPGTQPTSSACDTAGQTAPGESLTGLANALAHVCANLSLHTNSGLANAADRISANMSNHEARHGSSSDDSGTTEGGHGHGHAKQRGGHGHGKGRPTLGD